MSVESKAKCVFTAFSAVLCLSLHLKMPSSSDKTAELLRHAR